MSATSAARDPDHFALSHVTLRVAMAGVALAILAAVVVERTHQACLLTSISAYWYTDARAVFVGGLVAVGVSLVAYSGSTWTENLLLNLAGVLAPVVAFAPTPISVPRDLQCLGVAGVPRYPFSSTDNALVVYLGALVLGTVITIVASAALRHQLGPLTQAQRTARRVGLGAGVGLVVVLIGWRVLDPRFAPHVHFPAAGLMFLLLTAVVAGRTERVSLLTRRWDLYRDDALRASLRQREHFPYGKAYAGIAGVMGLTLLAVVVSTFLGGTPYAVIVAEVVLLAAFLVFWLLQTVQLRSLTSSGYDGGGGGAPSAPGPSPR